MTSDLTLYSIETELLDLLRLREDTANDPEAKPDDIKESISAIDGQISEYIAREVSKADGIANYLRECDARALALRQESKRIAEQAKRWEQRGERLERVTLETMQMIGKKRIEGRSSTLKVAKNPPKVDVVQAEFIPDVCKSVEVTMTVHLLDRVMESLRIAAVNERAASVYMEFRDAKRSAFQPMLAKIKEELKQACPACGGLGAKTAPLGGEIFACVACGGSGRNSVPGCRLVDDNVRLVVE